MSITAGAIDCGAQYVLETVNATSSSSDPTSNYWIVAQTGTYRPIAKVRGYNSFGQSKAYLYKYVDGGSDTALATTVTQVGVGTKENTGTDVTLNAGDKVYVKLDITSDYGGGTDGAKAQGSLGISQNSARLSFIYEVDTAGGQMGDIIGGANAADSID